MRRPAPLLALSLLAGCGRAPDPQQDLASLDNELTAPAAPAATRDPALTAALKDQIIVDPALAQQSNANAIRPPSRPDPGAVPTDATLALPDPVNAATLHHAPPPAADCPECRAAKGALTLGTLAGRQPGGAGCAALVRYSATWAGRLPHGVQLYPDARVSEAAGTDSNGCALRVVSFASGAPVSKVIDWYWTQAGAGGFTAGHRTDGSQHVLGGTRAGSAFLVYVSPRAGGGSDVDLLANGR